MIIPQFSLSQDDTHLIVVIRVPYVKISKTEFYIEKNSFKFYLKPYSLSLNFAQTLKEVEYPEHAVYDHNTYELTCKLAKEKKGEYFDDLNMITKLFEKSKKKAQSSQENKKKAQRALIEVVSSTLTEEEKVMETEILNKRDNEEGFEIFDKVKMGNYRYGFNQGFQGFFNDLEEELCELSDINPDESNYEERLILRDQLSLQNFDNNVYIYDLFENEEVSEMKKRPLKFVQNLQKLMATPNVSTSDIYEKDELDALIKLPRKEFIINDGNLIIREIVDILFAFLYEQRVMDDEFSSESAVTISKTSSTLSSFAVDATLEDVLHSCICKALIYPLVRNFEVALSAIEDLKSLLKIGNIAILKTFLRIKLLFEKSEPRYLLSRLYIEDYCIFIQMVSPGDWLALLEDLKKIKIYKEKIILNLVNLEENAIELFNKDFDDTL